MFRKLVSNLPFSPSLIGQLGFYARRLRKEQATRRIGLIFTVLALIIQSFAIISPPEAANAASSSDFIRGGIRSLNDLLTAYDSGSGDLKDIFTYAGVTRSEIARAKAGTVNSKDHSLLSWGRTSHFSAAKGEVAHPVPRKKGGSITVYSRPLHLWDTTSITRANGSSYQAYIGHSAKIGWFAILKNCANLVTKKLPKPAPAGSFNATCTSIRGFAYDGRRTDLKVSVIIYAGGPPGKGKKIAKIIANQSSPVSPAGKGHGFTISVPEEYRKAKKATPLFGVMVPLPGWSQSTVSIGQAIIPANCTPEPSAACTLLQLKRISRNVISLTSSSEVANGARIISYKFTVKDTSGRIVSQKTVTSSKTSASSGNLTLPEGSFTASVTVRTSLGEKTSSQCEAAFTVSPPEKCPLNPNLDANSPECKPCPGDNSIWVNDEKCEANITHGKLASNLTQNYSDANGTLARAGDRIEYTIFIENTGLRSATTSIEEQLKDVLEYAQLRDNGGGLFNENTKTLRWDNIELKPGERQTRKFVVETNTSIPATPQGISDPGSYDCKMTNTFGNTTEIRMDCPVVKGVEQTVSQLPKTGPEENLIFAGIVLAIVTYFYLRSRQLGKEVRLVRREFTTGTI